MQRTRVGITSFVILLTAWAVSAQTSSVTGRVTNQQGAAVADAEVSLVAPPGSAMPGMPAMRMNTTPERTVSRTSTTHPTILAGLRSRKR